MTKQLTIGHVVMFAPCRCGLYELARTMIKADLINGHNVAVFDSGVQNEGVPEIGSTDERDGLNIVISPFEDINKCDIIIMHTGLNDSYLVTTQQPIIWVVHGRPHACYKPETIGNGNSYTLYHDLSKWKRTKAMLYFWQEFKGHWNFKNKDYILEFPPIDFDRYYMDDKNKYLHLLKNKGDINIMICDSDREDIDIYNLLVAMCIYGETHKDKNVKLHLFGQDDKYTSNLAFKYLEQRLIDCGVYGGNYNRIYNINEYYRAMDCLLSPNSIVVQTIAEAQTTGLPVIGGMNSRVNNYQFNLNSVDDILED
jgi:glycosyltransferase involved in cell wall biosynthesis